MLDYQSQTAKILIDIKAINFDLNNHFTLTSGRKSPVYVDCRKIISYPNERNQILTFMQNYLSKNKIQFDLVAGGETAGIPYAAFLSERLNKPMIYIRKKPKGFGNDKQIEGNYKKNQKAILIEDLATDGGSKITFVEALRKAELIISDIFVIFYYDIFNFEKSPLSKMNLKIHALCTWNNIINILRIKKIFSENEISNLENFLNNPEEWRSKQ